VVIPKDRAASVTPAVVKASAGATEHVKITRVVNLASAIRRLKEEGVWIIGVEPASGKTIYDMDFTIDCAIVVGSEEKGARRLTRENSDFVAAIPMKGAVDSLNAASAGAVALFEARRQRGKG
jgi:23S rRNA (guanosine2251-2'-O)-methyltransferase